MSGPTSGLTRVAVLGANFVESPTTRVKFDNIEVMPIFHGPKTLICVTPKHIPGTGTPIAIFFFNKKKKVTKHTHTHTQTDTHTDTHTQKQNKKKTKKKHIKKKKKKKHQKKTTKTKHKKDQESFSHSFFLPILVEVRVCNDPKRWSESAGKFTYDPSMAQEEDNGTHAGEQSLRQGGGGGYSGGGGTWHAAFEGGFETARVLHDNGGIPGAASLPPVQQHALATKVRAAASRLDARGYSSLHYAAAYGMTEVLLWLLTVLKCDPLVRDSRGGYSILHWAVYYGHVATARALLSLIPQLIAQTDNEGHTALHVLACRPPPTITNSSDPLVELLLRAGVAVSAADVEGQTALHFAAASSRYDLVVQLVRQGGAFVNQTDARGDTALHWAVRNDDAAMVQLLLSPLVAANGFSKNDDEETPLFLALLLGADLRPLTSALVAGGCELTGDESRMLLSDSIESDDSMDDTSDDFSCSEGEDPLMSSSFDNYVPATFGCGGGAFATGGPFGRFATSGFVN